jgi:hypothetical protein
MYITVGFTTFSMVKVTSSPSMMPVMVREAETARSLRRLNSSGVMGVNGSRK